MMMMMIMTGRFYLLQHSMRVVTLCNKLTRAKGSKVDVDEDGGGPSGSRADTPTVVSNMLTGKQVQEVSCVK